MPEHQLALAGRPEIIFSGRGDKAACMNEDDRDDWGDVFHYETTLQRTITLEGLIERWAGKKIAGYALDLEGISQRVRVSDRLPAYILIREIGFSGGNRSCLVSQISYPELMREVKEGPKPSAMLFDLDDVEAFEMDNFTPTCKDNLQADTDCNPRSRNTLFKFILGLADLHKINLTEPGLATSLENATEAKGCKLPRSTADLLLREIAEFEKKIAN